MERQSGNPSPRPDFSVSPPSSLSIAPPPPSWSTPSPLIALSRGNASPTVAANNRNEDARETERRSVSRQATPEDRQTRVRLEFIANFLSCIGQTANDTILARVTRYLSETEDMVERVNQLPPSTMQELCQTIQSLQQWEIALSDRIANRPVPASPQGPSGPAPRPESAPNHGRILRQSEIPKFDGSSTNWPTFKTIFLELVTAHPGMSRAYVAHLLTSAMPDDKKELTASHGDDWLAAIQDLSGRMESRDNVRAELFKLVTSIARLTANATLSKWQQFLDQLRSIKRRAAPFGEIVESQLHILLAVKLEAFYATYMAKDHHASIDHLISFCEAHVRMLEDVQQHAAITGAAPATTCPSNSRRPLATLAASTGKEIEPCVFCGGDHRRKDCPLSRSNRRTKLRNGKRCFGCFIEFVRGERHQCDVSCRRCRRERMNTIVCPCRDSRASNDSRPTNEAPSAQSLAQATTQPVPSLATNSQSDLPAPIARLSTVVTQTADVPETVYLPTLGATAGCNRKKVRLLLDSGASSSFIAEATANELGATPFAIEPLYVRAFNGAACIKVGKAVRIELHALYSRKKCEVQLIVMPGILIGDLPAPSKSILDTASAKGIQLADKPDGGVAPIDIVIGQDIFNDHFLLDRQPCLRPRRGIVFIRTKFGWVVQGNPSGQMARRGFTRCAFISTEEIDTIDATNIGEADCICQNLITLFRDPRTDGDSSILAHEWAMQYESQLVHDQQERRFIAPLPWFDDKRPAPNFVAAAAQSHALYRKLERNGILERYNKAMEDLIKDGYAEVVQRYRRDDGFFLPHFPVIKATSQTTPLRPVFNASAHNRGQLSLNQTVFKGIWEHANLAKILMRWRCHDLVALADLKQAFLQIRVREEDRKYLRYIWFSKDGHQQVHQMKSILFGATASPYILHAVLRKLIATKAPELLPFIDDLYMDDALIIAESIDELMAQIKHITGILQQASFTLHKWTALPHVANQIGVKCEKTHSKYLGLKWDLEKDEINFEAIEQPEGPLTRRIIASAFAKNFDPLGLLGPYHTQLKLFMREIIIANKNWDQPISEEESSRARELMMQSQHLSSITVPRSIRASKEIEIWGFGDACKAAYGCCFYIFDKPSSKANLLMSKGRLASTKAATIPQLELAAAVLVSETWSLVRTTFSVTDIRARFFTDSSITWHRIQGDRNRLDHYVGSRIAKIQSFTDANDWYHITGVHNPADIIARGLPLSSLVNNELWFHGPTIEAVRTSEEETKSLSSSKIFANAMRCTDQPSDCAINENLVASLSYKSYRWFHRRLLTFMNRYTDIRKRFVETHNNTAAGAVMGDIITWRQIQSVILRNEVAALNKDQEVPPSSPFFKQRPFLDSYGLMRIRRRLDFANHLEYEVKYPIALIDNPMTRSYIKHVHETDARHSGATTTEMVLRRCIYLPNAARIVSQVVQACMTCRRLRTGRTFAPPTAPLPPERATGGRAWEVVGVDLFGPLHDARGRLMKFYGFIFTCAKSRAVHLEVVESKSAIAIMHAFIRFQGLYGAPKRIRSDNEKGFHKASKIMRAIQEAYDQAKNKMRENRPDIEWVFNVPRASWWGGSWERLIQSVKRAIGRMRFEASTSYEQIETILREAQAFVNRRPLLRRGDHLPITPAHLIFGRPLEELPPLRIPLRRPAKDDAIVEYNLLQAALDEFWKAWTQEYLLALRPQWGPSTREPLLNELVVVQDDRAARAYWPLGYIDRLHRGRDGVARAARIRLLENRVHGDEPKEEKFVVRPLQRLVPIERQLGGEDVARQAATVSAQATPSADNVE